MATKEVRSNENTVFAYEFDAEKHRLALEEPFSDIDGHIKRLRKVASEFVLRKRTKGNLRYAEEALEKLEAGSNVNGFPSS